MIGEEGETQLLRVLIVDDSSLVVDILRTILETDPALHVVGVARDGREAVALVRQLKPDLVTMDIRMPVMDGLEATAAIMEETPVPILVVADAVVEDTSIAFRAIQAGAIDVVQKPPFSLERDYQRLDLVRRARIVASVTPIRRLRRTVRTITASPAQGAGERLAVAPERARAIGIIGIAASTGGPAALATVLGALPADFDTPLVVVQHIAPGFLDGFVEWLASVVPLRTRVARAGDRPEPGVATFAPEGSHLVVAPSGRFELSDAPPRDGHRPSATVMFESLAKVYGARAAGVLLTGMGRDGAEGLSVLRKAGGRTICQDEATSVVHGMPRAAIELGAADRVVPIDRVAAEVLAALSR